MSGYSGTPLAKKLGIKEGFKVYVENAPQNYLKRLGPIPHGATATESLSDDLDIAHLFTKSKNDLQKRLTFLLKKIKQNGMIWVSWPKKASGVATDVTEDVVRQIALPLGLVDTKVCAVDEIWSGLRLVIRKELRRNP